MSRAARLCIVALGALLGITAVGGALWCLLKPTTTADWIGLLNLLVLAGTGAVVAWYTWETRLLRFATHRQTTLQIRPFLSLQHSQADRKLWIHNIARGVAREIRIHNVSLARELDAKTYVTVEWVPIDFIAGGEKRELVGVGQLVSREQKQELSKNLRGWMANFGQHGQQEYELVIDYCDLIGQRYRVAFEIAQGRTTMLRDVQLESIR